MYIIVKCDLCKKNRLWLLVKHRSIKPNDFMPKVKSKKKMCNGCFKNVERYFVKQGIHKLEEK